MNDADADAKLEQLLGSFKLSGVILDKDTPSCVPDDYVYSDGVRKADVIAAIQAAGAAREYTFAHRLCVYYNIVACVRCAGPNPTAALWKMGRKADRNSWGSVCDPCAYLVGLEAALRWSKAVPK